MSKFCMQCGAQLEDNTAVCPSCGAKQSPVNPQPQTSAEATAENTNQTNSSAPEQNASTSQANASSPKIDLGNIAESIPQVDIDSIKNMAPEKKKKVGLIAIIAAAVLVLLIILRVIVSAGAYKDPFNNYAKALNTGKGKYIYNALPDYLLDSVFEDYKRSEVIEEFDDMLDDLTDMLENKYGKNYKCTVEFVDKDKITKKKLREMEKTIKLTYGEKVDVTKGYEVTVKTKTKGKDGKDTATNEYKVYKIDGDWCCPELYNSYTSSSYWDYDDDIEDLGDALDKLQDLFD